ncbi:uncharacterized protein [Diadema setosum]|uniref:uncharacterized protein n=1 Tax=Diadema setosum TaxID=31175 RepID=UPI003B3B11B7
MDPKSGKYAAAALIWTGIMLSGVLHMSVATQCFKCEFWPSNSTDLSCLHPGETSSSSAWSDGMEIVECEHACFVSNYSSGTVESTKISRGCYKDEFCPDMCVIDPVVGWEACMHCCDDDLCNDVDPEETFEDSTWCYDCGSYDSDCVDPSPEKTVRTTCDTRCEMNVYISEQTTVMRGCALSEEDCNDCDDKEDCTFCCEGSYCNDAPPDVIARQSNLTQDCYSCYYSPNAFEVADSGACGTDFDPNGVGVELVQCSGMCKKVVSGSSIERSCVHNFKDCDPGCRMFGSCTYCCEGNLCNRAGRSTAPSALLATLALALSLTALNLV